MNLDRVAVVLRDRPGSRGIDVGLLLGRRCFLAVLRPWVLLVVPMMLVLQLGTYAVTGSIVFSLLVAWWFKPLYDRVTLFVISRSFFGTVPGTAETLGAMVGQWFSKAALWDLTAARFSVLRAATIPIRVLEGGPVMASMARARGLLSSNSQASLAGFLYFVLVIKGFLYLSVVAIFVAVMPEELLEDVWYLLEEFFFGGSSWGLMLFLAVTTTLISALVEPFHQAGGFGVYIQRRIVREGWDLELKFRQMARRLGQALVVLMLLPWLVMVAPSVGHSQEEVMVSGGDEMMSLEEPEVSLKRSRIPVEDPEKVMRGILQEPPFARETVMEEHWRRQSEETRELREPGEFWYHLAQLGSAILRVLIWILVVTGVMFVAWKLFRYLREQEFSGVEEGRKARWEEELLKEGGEGGMPDDVVGAARRYFTEGEGRRALALLLLSSLLLFEERNRFQFPPGWTTARCARMVAQRGKDGPVVAEVARAFDRIAWAGEALSERGFELLLEQYIRVFGQGRRS